MDMTARPLQAAYMHIQVCSIGDSSSGVPSTADDKTISVIVCFFYNNLYGCCKAYNKFKVLEIKLITFFRIKISSNETSDRFSWQVKFSKLYVTVFWKLTNCRE